MARRLTIPLLVCLALLPGCSRTTATQGRHDIRADWWSPSLEAYLPETYRAADVAAAADSALVRMGYTVTDRTESDDRAIVTASPPGAGPLDKVVVRAIPSGRRVLVRVSTRPLGDEDRARIVMDEMLVLLGL